MPDRDVEDATPINRRGVLAIGLGLGLVGAAGAGCATSHASGGSSVGTVASGVFRHPGLLHADADFARMTMKVAAGEQPWQAGWNRLVANPHAQRSWTAKPVATVYRGTGSPENYAKWYNDIHAAYQNALRYRIAGTQEHGDAARMILNAWSHTLKEVTGSSDKFLAAGIYGYQFANAAELMRGHPGFDLDAAKAMLKTAVYPLCHSFLATHNGADKAHYWANWDLCNMAAILAIGILCDDKAMVTEAVDYFTHGEGNGSIAHAVPVIHPGGLGQWQESGRDQGHAMLGIGLLGAICEMAWNQGYDLYGHDDNRFLKGCEYVAKYNLGQPVPFTPFTWLEPGAPGKSVPQQIADVSAKDRGDLRPIWELVYHHYVGRRGLAAPYTTQYAAKVRAEGGGGDYGPDSGGFDQLGFGTLLYTR